MRKSKWLLGFTLMATVLSAAHLLTEKPAVFGKKAKVALRQVGHTMLLDLQDSTSLILPVTESEENTFTLRLEKPVVFDPEAFVTPTHRIFERFDLPGNYLVEVKHCETKELVFSYLMDGTLEESLIPCLGRTLPEACYLISFSFSPEGEHFNLIGTSGLLLSAACLAFLLIGSPHRPGEEKPYILIGKSSFYYKQQAIARGNHKTNLTAKECHLLLILARNIGVLVTRDILLKEVWEDQGVIVGRSLDVFISRLRKKLEQHHPDLTIMNIHGAGYRLEIAR